MLDLPFLKISVATNVALAAALVFVMLRADAISNDRDTQKGAVQIVADRHALTKLSLEQCNQGMSEIVADGAGRDDRLAQHAARQLEEAKAIREQAEALIKGGPTRDCRTSPGAMRNKDL